MPEESDRQFRPSDQDVPVENPCAAAPDLEFVAEADEIDGLDWWLEWLPIPEMYAPEHLDDGITLPGESASQAATRWAGVREWIAGKGGPEAALAESPVIAIWDGDDAYIPLDGWHRCVIAWRDYDAWKVPALIGHPRPEPDTAPSTGDMEGP